MITLAEEQPQIRIPGPVTFEDLEGVRIYTADCRDALRTMEPESIDTIITDPPYGLGFMGKEWDTFDPSFIEQDVAAGIRKTDRIKSDLASGGFSAGRYNRDRAANVAFQATMTEFFVEAFRVAKPGAMLFVFGGTRTFHRAACAIEDAGWEIRDTMGWLHGQGFPKSHNLAGAIDRKLGHGPRGHAIATAGTVQVSTGKELPPGDRMDAYQARSPEAEPWTGYGTALKPAWEPICVAMKPLDGTYAENALKHGIGGLNIDAARIQTGEQTGWGGGGSKLYDGGLSREGGDSRPTDLGRWPANILHDGSEEATSVFPDAPGQQGEVTGREPSSLTNEIYGQFGGRPASSPRGDFGSAARFFYCAKASKEEREEGLEGLEGLEGHTTSDGRTVTNDTAYQRGKNVRKNHHPTVKPLSLMRYLVRLAKMPARPGYRQKVLDICAGSGTTGVAGILEDVDVVLMEKTPDHVALIRGRCLHAIKQKSLQPELFSEPTIAAIVEDKKQAELF